MDPKGANSEVFTVADSDWMSCCNWIKAGARVRVLEMSIVKIIPLEFV